MKKLMLLLVALAGCFEAPEETTSKSPVGGSVSITDPSDGVCVAIGIKGTDVQPNNSPNGCLCTRRDEQPRGMCTRGGGDSVSAMIGPAGGTIMLEGQQGGTSGVPFTLEIPPDALVTPTVIKITETSLPPPAVDWSPVYRLEPVSLVFARPAKVKVPWSQGPIWGAPTLYWSETSLCTLNALPSSSSNAGFNQGEITRLGYAMSAYSSQGSAPMCK